VLQVGEGTTLPPQIGTLLCVKVLVPQTGNAVEGFCPGALQGVTVCETAKE